MKQLHLMIEIHSGLIVGIHLLKVNGRNSRTRCEICSNLTIKTSVRRHWRRVDVFIVNFEHISHRVSIVNFEHVIVDWVNRNVKQLILEKSEIYRK